MASSFATSTILGIRHSPGLDGLADAQGHTNDIMASGSRYTPLAMHMPPEGLAQAQACLSDEASGPLTESTSAQRTTTFCRHCQK